MRAGGMYRSPLAFERVLRDETVCSNCTCSCMPPGDAVALGTAVSSLVMAAWCTSAGELWVARHRSSISNLAAETET